MCCQSGRGVSFARCILFACGVAAAVTAADAAEASARDCTFRGGYRRREVGTGWRGGGVGAAGGRVVVGGDVAAARDVIPAIGEVAGVSGVIAFVFGDAIAGLIDAELGVVVD